MNVFTQFSNSWGHLVMSLVLIATGLVLVLWSNDAELKGVGVTLILTASGYWFASSVASHTTPPPLPPATLTQPDTIDKSTQV